jgi:hypothetical protein
MPPRHNPLKLNPLQLKTLTLLQELARDERRAQPEEDGVRVIDLPRPHGNHFHVGHYVVSAADATGLHNENVWRALERKGLIHAYFPIGLKVTRAGLDYETGLRDAVLHGSDH